MRGLTELFITRLSVVVLPTLRNMGIFFLWFVLFKRVTHSSAAWENQLRQINIYLKYLPTRNPVIYEEENNIIFTNVVSTFWEFLSLRHKHF